MILNVIQNQKLILKKYILNNYLKFLVWKISNQSIHKYILHTLHIHLLVDALRVV